ATVEGRAGADRNIAGGYGQIDAAMKTPGKTQLTQGVDVTPQGLGGEAIAVGKLLDILSAFNLQPCQDVALSAGQSAPIHCLLPQKEFWVVGNDPGQAGVPE